MMAQTDAAPATPPEAASALERRRFQRHDMGLSAYLDGDPVNRAAAPECVRVLDLSGDGALFRTLHPQRYTPGQRMALTICMPGAPGVQAVMKTRAVVIRVEIIADENETPPGGRVAVQFRRALQFHRDPAGEPGVDCK